MKCPYCNKDMKLKRWLKEDWGDEGKYKYERFVYECPDCSIVLSPRFLSIDDCETEEEKKLIRDLYFHTKKKEVESAIKY